MKHRFRDLIKNSYFYDLFSVFSKRFSDKSIISFIFVIVMFKMAYIIISTSYFNTADELFNYNYWSIEISNFLKNQPHINLSFIDDSIAPFVYLSGFVYYIFGNNIIFGKLLNLLFHIISVFLVYKITELLFEKRTAIISLFMFLLMPSINIWSLFFLRESMIIMMLLLSLFFIIKFYKTNNFVFFIISLFFSYIYYVMREHIGILLVLIVIFLFLIKIKKLYSSVILFLVFVVLLINYSIIYDYSPNYIIDSIIHERNLVAGEGGTSRFLEDYKTNDVIDLLLYLPLGIIYFLFAPFPWNVNSTMMMFYFIDSLVFYLLFPFMIYGIYSALKTKDGLLYCILIFMFLVAIFYALIEVNVGNLARHKIQFTSIAIIFIAKGINNIFIKGKK